MSSKSQLQLKFAQSNLTKTNELLSQTRVFQELLMFMDYKIRNQLKTFTLMSLCNGERTKFMVDIFFENAFSNMSLQEQVQLYDKTIKLAVAIQNKEKSMKQSAVKIEVEEDSDDYQQRKEPVRFRVDIEKGFHSWQQIYLTIDGFKVTSEQMEFDIRNYMMRRSKKKDKDCYVLQAIHQSVPDVIRFCFLTNGDSKSYLPLLKELLERGYKEMIKRMYNIEVKERTASDKKKLGRSPQQRFSEEGTREKRSQDENKFKLVLQPLPEQFQFQRAESRIVEQIIKNPLDQNMSMQLNQIVSDQNQKYNNQQRLTKQKFKQVQRWYKNVFSIIFPSFDLSQLDRFDQYKVAISCEKRDCIVFQHNSNQNLFKLQLVVSMEPEKAVRVITNVPLYKNWHPEVTQGDIKLQISSENSTISYQKHKSYSQWYRERDYLYLRHVFKLGQDYYVADKSIENSNFFPLGPIHRARFIYQIFKISPSPSGCKLIIECEMQHGGLLNRSHAAELTIRYLSGFEKMQSYFKKKQFESKLKGYFNIQWRIRQIPSSDSMIPRQTTKDEINDSEFQVEAISRIEDSDIFFSIKDQTEKDQQGSFHEIEEVQLRTKKEVELVGSEVIQVNEEGLIILPKDYLNVRHPEGIVETAERNKMRSKFPNFLLRDTWQFSEQGGLVLINKKMMAAQDSVLSFLMSTFKKNLFSGKGALNISLPVTIFNCDSQLSRYALSCCSGPQYLQRAASCKDVKQRMKFTMIFGLTHSLLFFDMQKPFNPILGETFQCFIAGCPFYAEQISHHPPVSSILFLGRGYKVYANLQATVNIHLNSADGINMGWYHVVFKDGQQICFQTPPAEFSGFAYGDRKFNFKSKGYYFDRENNLFAEMSFQDNSGIFSSKKWKFRDQLEAQILTVKSEFLNKFVDNFSQKQPSPEKKDILDRHGKFQGRWTQSVSFEGQQIYAINTNIPYEMVNYQYPLNSNTNYREDLYYRKLQDLSRSQSQKQRLENVQRGDRKWRDKYHGKKH